MQNCIETTKAFTELAGRCVEGLVEPFDETLVRGKDRRNDAKEDEHRAKSCEMEGSHHGLTRAPAPSKGATSQMPESRRGNEGQAKNFC